MHKIRLILNNCLLFVYLTLLSYHHIYCDKVRMYEEIMMNDDNLESNLLISSLLKMCCLVQVELEMFTAWWQEMN